MHALLFLLACGASPEAPTSPPQTAAAEARPEAPAARKVVRSTSFPAAWLVTRLAGQLVNHENVHPAGEDPPSWQPPGELVAGLATADLIVANGAGFEAWMATAALPASRVVQSASGAELITLEGKTHSHGTGGEHTHAGTDPHTWSDPVTLLGQARVVHQALVQADPAHQPAYDANLGTLTAELEALDGELRAATAGGKGRPLSASHPAFNYLARRYELSIHSFDFDPEEVPSAEQVAAFSAWWSGKGDPVLLWEAQPTEGVRAAFPANTRHVYVDPLEGPPDAGTYDYLTQARGNVATFAGLFAQADAP